jgi:hypothetical protein
MGREELAEDTAMRRWLKIRIDCGCIITRHDIKYLLWSSSTVGGLGLGYGLRIDVIRC